MKRYFFVFFILVNLYASAQQEKSVTDSNTLVVVNGNVAGTLREIKKDLDNLFPKDMIESVNVLKGEAAIKKYGDKGKAGVIEFTLKGATIMEGKIIQQYNPPGDSVFNKVDIEASFPGGDGTWRRYLERNLNAQVPSDKHAPSGTYTVIAQFVVGKDGTISDVKALTNHGFGMEEEVIRVISKGPNWVPAVMNGRMVKAYRKQPITFQIISEFELSTYKITAGKTTEIELKTDAGEKPEDLEVTLSYGTITHKEGNTYTILVDKPGKVLLNVKKKAKKKKDEYDYGSAEIKVE